MILKLNLLNYPRNLYKSVNFKLIMKLRGIYSLFVLSIIFVSMFGFVSAGPVESANSAIDSATRFLEPILKLVLGDTPSGEFLFAKVLFLVIILSIVWVTLSRVPLFSDYDYVLWAVSIAVSILAVRWISSETIINTIILPYSALAIALTAGLPFVLFFLVVNVGMAGPHSTLRRIAWIFFAVVFVGLWISRYDTLTTVGDGFNGSYIYIWTAILAFLVCLMDGTINHFFVQLQIEKAGVNSKEELITQLTRKLNELNSDLADGIITQDQFTKRQKDYQKRIVALNR